MQEKFDTGKLRIWLERYQMVLVLYHSVLNADKEKLHAQRMDWCSDLKDTIMQLEDDRVIKIEDRETLNDYLNISKKESEDRVKNFIETSTHRIEELYTRINALVNPYGFSMLTHEEYLKQHQNPDSFSGEELSFRLDISFREFFNSLSIDFLIDGADMEATKKIPYQSPEKQFKKEEDFSVVPRNEGKIHYYLQNQEGDASLITIQYSQPQELLQYLTIHSINWKDDMPLTVINGNYIKGISQIIGQYIDTKTRSSKP